MCALFKEGGEGLRSWKEMIEDRSNPLKFEPWRICLRRNRRSAPAPTTSAPNEIRTGHARHLQHRVEFPSSRIWPSQLPRVDCPLALRTGCGISGSDGESSGFPFVDTNLLQPILHPSDFSDTCHLPLEKTSLPTKAYPQKPRGPTHFTVCLRRHRRILPRECYGLGHRSASRTVRAPVAWKARSTIAVLVMKKGEVVVR